MNNEKITSLSDKHEKQYTSSEVIHRKTQENINAKNKTEKECLPDRQEKLRPVHYKKILHPKISEAIKKAAEQIAHWAMFESANRKRMSAPLPMPLLKYRTNRYASSNFRFWKKSQKQKSWPESEKSRCCLPPIPWFSSHTQSNVPAHNDEKRIARSNRHQEKMQYHIEISIWNNSNNKPHDSFPDEERNGFFLCCRKITAPKKKYRIEKIIKHNRQIKKNQANVLPSEKSPLFSSFSSMPDHNINSLYSLWHTLCYLL